MSTTSKSTGFKDGKFDGTARYFQDFEEALQDKLMSKGVEYIIHGDVPDMNTPRVMSGEFIKYLKTKA